MEKASVSVKIYNSTYALTTSASEEQVLKIAAEVDRRMQELAESKKLLQTDKIAIWTALDLAADRLELQEKYAALQQEMQQQSVAAEQKMQEKCAAMEQELQQKCAAAEQKNTGKICCARAGNAAKKCCAGRRAAKPAGQIRQTAGSSA